MQSAAQSACVGSGDTSAKIADTTGLRSAPAQKCSAIRPFVASDAKDVADLLVRAFQHSERPAPPGMGAYLREVYLDAPWFDPQIASRVMVRHDGRVIGFIGVSAMPMLIDGRTIRTAIISSLASDPSLADAMTGPRLLRDVRSGPQDAILNDRSNKIAVSMLQSLKFEVIRSYSFAWIRALRPAAFVIETLASRFGPLRLLAPLVTRVDEAAVAKALSAEAPRWSVSGRSRVADAFTDRDADSSELLDLVPRFLAHFPLRPVWGKGDLSVVLRDAARKSELGDFISRVVLAPNGDPIGLFLYHLRRRLIAHVLQIMAAKGREGVVLDRAIAHAASHGAVAIRGRTHPAIVDALMARRTIFVPELATVVYSRDPAVLKHFREGNAFFTGLAGENWMRLNGDQL